MTNKLRHRVAIMDKPRFQKGISLIEVMVGLAIAMLLFLVISGVFMNFENQKRITSLSSDTQSSGVMAIFELEQAIRSAGAGIVSEDSFDCNPAKTFSYFRNIDATPAELSPVPGYGQYFVPAVITNNNSNGSDTLEIRVGAPVANSVPTELAQKIFKAEPNAEELIVKRGQGFPVGSVLMLVNGDTCAVVEVTDVPDPAQPNLMSIAPPTTITNTWNPSLAYKNTNNWPDFVKEGTYVYTPGPSTGMVFRTYSVNASGQLQVVNSKAGAATTTEVLVGDVVSFHAQYGVSSAAGVQDIANWVEPTGNFAPANLTADRAKQIKAIRLVIVMRSPKLEPANTTGTCVNNAGTNNGPCAWADTAADPSPLIDLSGDTNWHRYRYRTFQTIIPLRNTISTGV